MNNVARQRHPIQKNFRLSATFMFIFSKIVKYCCCLDEFMATEMLLCRIFLCFEHHGEIAVSGYMNDSEV